MQSGIKRLRWAVRSNVGPEQAPSRRSAADQPTLVTSGEVVIDVVAVVTVIDGMWCRLEQ